MTTTAAQVVQQTLQLLTVQASEQPISQDEAADAIQAMNDYMFMLDGLGVTLGYTEVDSLSDEITIPAACIQGLKYNLAILLAPQYDAAVTPAIVQGAERGEKTMYQLGVTIGNTYFPDTLPRGTGNDDDDTTYRSRYYRNPQEDILAETNGSIALEGRTNDGDSN